MLVQDISKYVTVESNYSSKWAGIILCEKRMTNIVLVLIIKDGMGKLLKKRQLKVINKNWLSKIEPMNIEINKDWLNIHSLPNYIIKRGYNFLTY